MDTYQVITVAMGFSHKKAIDTLTREVNQAIVRGWKPIGGVTMSGTLLCQAVLKDR